LRLIDDEGVPFWARFDEAATTFSLCDENGVCSDGLPPGTNEVVANAEAVLDLAKSAVVGSGPTGPSVDLVFAFTLERNSKGRSLRIEAAATEDDGTEQDFAEVGRLQVEGGGGNGCSLESRPQHRGSAWHLILPTFLLLSVHLSAKVRKRAKDRSTNAIRAF
jgi:hypothetical protein